jgi:hypothetical protein
MTNIHKLELGEIIDNLPDIISLDIKDESFKEEGDLFICALGFEPRCLSIIRMLHSIQYKAKRSLYLQYDTNKEDNEVNLPELLELLDDISGNIKPLEADITDFTNQFRTVMEGLDYGDGSLVPTIIFDISSVANRLLFICLKILLEFNISLRILYSEAELYHPTNDEYTENPQKWESEQEFGLEKGVSMLESSREYPGLHLDLLPNCIVLFPNFKAERSNAVIAKIDPALLNKSSEKINWILGRPHKKEDLWRLEAMRKINKIGEKQVQYELCTFNYKETLITLDRIYEKFWANHNITLSPLGSKMQSIGSTLFCYLHPDVHIIFAIPAEYNAVHYSEGCKATWMIDFGSIFHLKVLLKSVGKLIIKEDKGT